MRSRGDRAANIPIAVVFDGDDTLWNTEELYDAARREAAQIVSESGLDATRWEEIERRLDVDNVAHLGYSRSRFPRSCIQAYEQVCSEAAQSLDPRISTSIREVAESVFHRQPTLKRGARWILNRLRRRGVRLALLTKGDPIVQQQRIASSGLRPMFDLVRVVDTKTPGVIRAIIAELGSTSGESWMVGNSVRSDVLPALEAGLHVAWIDAHVWEHERTHDHLVDHRVRAVASLKDFAKLIAA